MSEYCSDCGGKPHPGEPGVAGTPGHPMKWGRLAPPLSLREYVPSEEGLLQDDGPFEVRQEFPKDAPKNATWLLSVPTTETRIVESKGIWKGRELHLLGIAGICEEDVRFYSKWKKSGDTWKSDEHWLRVDGIGRRVSWTELKGELRERLAGL